MNLLKFISFNQLINPGVVLFTEFNSEVVLNLNDLYSLPDGIRASVLKKNTDYEVILQITWIQDKKAVGRAIRLIGIKEENEKNDQILKFECATTIIEAKLRGKNLSQLIMNSDAKLLKILSNNAGSFIRISASRLTTDLAWGSLAWARHFNYYEPLKKYHLEQVLRVLDKLSGLSHTQKEYVVQKIHHFESPEEFKKLTVTDDNGDEMTWKLEDSERGGHEKSVYKFPLGIALLLQTEWTGVCYPNR